MTILVSSEIAEFCKYDGQDVCGYWGNFLFCKFFHNRDKEDNPPGVHRNEHPWCAAVEHHDPRTLCHR